MWQQVAASGASLLTGGWLIAAVEEVSTSGPDLTGIAAIIAASAGLLSAVGALVLGFRRPPASTDDVKDELILELIEERERARRRRQEAEE